LIKNRAEEFVFEILGNYHQIYTKAIKDELLEVLNKYTHHEVEKDHFNKL
jgi:septum formation topological specificity factor MinE